MFEILIFSVSTIFCLVGMWHIESSKEKTDKSIENAQKALNKFAITELNKFKK